MTNSTKASNATKPDAQYLAHSLFRACMDNPWAADHKQIAGAILRAEKYIFEFECADIIATRFEEEPWKTEARIREIKWPRTPIWIEWPLPAGIVKVVGQGAVTGALIIPHPDFEDVIVVVTSWRESAEAEAKHSYATAILSKETLSKKIKLPVVKSDDERFRSHQRILENIGVIISDDLQDELLLKFSGDAEVIGEAKKSATGEIPLLFALMVYISNNKNAITKGEGDWSNVSLKPDTNMAPNSSVWTKFMTKISSLRKARSRFE